VPVRDLVEDLAGGGDDATSAARHLVLLVSFRRPAKSVVPIAWGI
jgi:hypothetical protein